MADSKQETDEEVYDPPPRERRSDRIRRAVKLGPKQRDLLTLLFLREGSGFTLAVLMLILQWGAPLHVRGPINEWMIGYIVFLAVLSNCVNIWYIFCQANAVDVSTREDRPTKDTQATADNGWSNFPIYAVILMFFASGFGWILDVPMQHFAKNPQDIFWRDRLIISWPMLFESIFVLAIVFRIDLKIFGPLFQRINNFKGRHSRFDMDGAHQ